MLSDSTPAMTAEAARAALLWWQSAGVDVLVDDAPRSWLTAPPVLEAQPVTGRSAAPAHPARVEMPASLDALVARLLADPELAEAGPPSHRIAASGNPAAPLMVMIDTPDQGDATRGALLTGESSALFDRMLAALGRSRDECYLAALCPGAPASGLLPSSAVPRYAELARLHVALAGAQTVWLLGHAAIRAIMEADALPLPQGLQIFNHQGANKALVAGLAPRFLQQQPGYKAQVWAAMQPLRTGNTV